MSGASSDSTAPPVVVEHVTKTFRRGPETITAVDDVSLRLHPGELVALLGPSGAGTSAMLELVLGWQRPDAGSVTGDDSPPDWRRLAVVPQQLGLLPHLTFFENVELAVRSTGERVGGRDADIDAMLGGLGLDGLADRFPGETSLGEQQRCAVARCLITRPRMVIADEPTSHQDDRSADRIIDALLAAVAMGAAVLVATHDRRITARSSRVLTMLDGRLFDEPLDWSPGGESNP
ncbi:MAG: ATP-binding cassette domain-containing protein [Acidimicrobiia bacterium]